MLQKLGVLFIHFFSVLFYALVLDLKKKCKPGILTPYHWKHTCFGNFGVESRILWIFHLETSFHASIRGKITTPNFDDFAEKKHTRIWW